MTTSFRTNIKATGKNTGIEIPAEVMARLGSRRTPAVKVSVDGYSYRSTVAVVSGVFMIPLSAAHREAAGVNAGDSVEVIVELDLEPRTVAVPDDLASALDQVGMRDTFESLAPSRRKEFVRQVEEAKSPETRSRRIAKILAALVSR